MGTSRWKPLPPEVTGAARDLAEHLRSLVTDAGLSLRRLAADDEVPYSLTTLHRYFSGQAVPPRHFIEVVARRCGGDLDELRRLCELARRQRLAARAEARMARMARRDIKQGKSRRARVLVVAAGVALGAAAVLVLAIMLPGGGPGGHQPTRPPDLGAGPPRSQTPPPTLSTSPQPTSTRTATPRPTPRRKPTRPPSSAPATPRTENRAPPKRTTAEAEPAQPEPEQPNRADDACAEIQKRYDIPITCRTGSSPIPMTGAGP